jgi:hypothetical protein
MLDIPIYIGDLFDNEITTIDFTVMFDPEFLSATNVFRGAALPAGWTLLIRNIFADRVLVRLTGPSPLPASGEIIQIRCAVNPDVLVGRSCRIYVDDLLFNLGMSELPVPVQGSGVFVVGGELRYFWKGMLIYFDGAWVRQDSMSFGLLDAATGNYDRGIDLIDIPPFPGHLDGFFLSDDWRKLGRDIRPVGGEVVWTAFFEEDGYVRWDPKQMWRGLIIGGMHDMSVESVFAVEAGEPVYITFNTTPGEYEWEVNVERGWNLVSVPITIPGMAVSAFFPTAMGNLWTWNNATLVYDEVTTVQSGKAYWLLSNIDTTYTRMGNAVYSFDRTLTAGWIMLGSPAHHTYLSDQALTPTNAFLAGTFYYYKNEGVPGYEPTTLLSPGRGQWIYCRVPASLRVSCIYLPKAIPSVERVAEAFGELYISDEPGQSVEFAMIENPMDYPAPPQFPGARGTIYLDGFMPLLRSERAPAKNASWTGVVEVSKQQSTLEWNIEGKAGFTLEIDGAIYDMSELNSIPISTGAHSFKVSVKNVALPTELALLPNYPNPFNAATQIVFALPENAEVKLAILDITGRNVTTLANDKFDAGYHRVVWNGKDDAGRNMPSGVYFSKLTVAEKSVSGKLLLVK